jgi:hypothetical protein
LCPYRPWAFSPGYSPVPANTIVQQSILST